MTNSISFKMHYCLEIQSETDNQNFTLNTYRYFGKIKCNLQFTNRAYQKYELIM